MHLTPHKSSSAFRLVILQYCIYCMSDHLHSSWTLRMKAAIMFSFRRGDADSLRKVLHPSVYTSAVFALNAVWKCSLAITYHLWLQSHCWYCGEYFNCIKFTCLGYAMPKYFPKMQQNNTLYIMSIKWDWGGSVNTFRWQYLICKKKLVYNALLCCLL